MACFEEYLVNITVQSSTVFEERDKSICDFIADWCRPLVIGTRNQEYSLQGSSFRFKGSIESICVVWMFGCPSQSMMLVESNPADSSLPGCLCMYGWPGLEVWLILSGRRGRFG